MGPEKLIKMATGQLHDAYGMRRQPPRQWRHLWVKQRLGLSRPSRLERRVWGLAQVPMRRGR